jgi:hypothetical protein
MARRESHSEWRCPCAELFPLRTSIERLVLYSFLWTADTLLCFFDTTFRVLNSFAWQLS